MGAITGLLGFGGGAAGTSFAGPQQAQIVAPTTSQQVGQAYTGTQQSLSSQQALLQALQAQQGLQNQNQVYGQLQGIASGAVNPAQAQFAQNTSQNVANQAALMAGQRGANQNVGLIARQAAQQGAATQQQAVGQEAAQQAANQVAAIGAAGNLATTQAQQQIGQTNANVQAQQAEQANLLSALQGYNTANVASQANVNQANAALAGQQMQGQQGLIGGGLGSLGLSGFSAAKGAQGGEVEKMAGGGYAGGQAFGGGSSPTFGDFLAQQSPVSGAPSPLVPSSNISYTPESGFGKGKPKTSTPNASGTPTAGGPVESRDPGAISSAPQGSALSLSGMGAANGGMAKDFRSGGKVNASSQKEKAVSKGNDYANDKIPAVLSEHEIVLPRDVTMSKDPVGESAKFVSKIIQKRRAGK